MCDGLNRKASVREKTFSRELVEAGTKSREDHHKYQHKKNLQNTMTGDHNRLQIIHEKLKEYL